MADDEELAASIRKLVGKRPDPTETKRFGGLAFLVGGMAEAQTSTITGSTIGRRRVRS